MKFKIADSKFKELLLPTLLIVMALNISSVVDTFFVTSFISKNAAAAIQLLEPLILLITVFEWLFGLGGQILALNKKAEFDVDGSNIYFTTSIVVSLIVSVLMAAVCLLYAEPLGIFLGINATTKPLLMDYSKYLYGCFILSTLVGVFSQYIRVDGQPKFASAIIIIANVINLTLDYVFLSSGMGMGGASLATFIGYGIGLILCIFYILDSKRTFRFVKKAVEIKTFLKSTWEMIKVGAPGASIGIFDVIFVYILNLFLSAVLGNTGLITYTICTNALVIASILDIGISETLTSIVPIYYAKHDYLNLNHLIKNSIILMMAGALILIVILWIWPQGFLSLYNFKNVDIVDFVTNALRLYSIFFIVSVIPNLLIFYYEAIKRPILSGIISVLYTFLIPLISIIALYNLMGSDGIWIAFSISSLITMGIIIILVKIIQKREKEYSGLFFIEKDLISKTKNFILTDNDLNVRKECLQHLKNLNASDEFCNNIDKIYDVIFKTNAPGTYVEMLIIDYDDRIHVDIKYDGEHENLENLKHNFPENLFKYTEVLGFNTIEYELHKN